MSPRSTSVKRQEWTERLVRFESANQTVVEFCRSEGISQPSFYQWRKKLKASSRSTDSVDSAVPTSSKTECNNFHPVALIPQAQQGLKLFVPGGIELELGNDLAVIQAVVKQLVESTVPQTERSEC